MSPEPAIGELVVRRIPFEFGDDLAPIWNPEHAEWSYMVNGASLVMPYLEPFLIATVRDAAKEIDDEAVLEQARGFASQEGQHFRTHRRYNELLKRNGYPTLELVEANMKRSYDKLRERSLTFRLAYTSGFETMTVGVTDWLVGERVRLFGGADTRVASFVLWHFVEESEHKSVAFDVYQAARGRYWQRVLGVFVGSFHVFWWSRKGTVEMLKVDGRWRSLRSRWRLWKRTAEFFVNVLPVVIRSMSPAHDPRDHADPHWVREWINGYAAASDGPVPLLDTSDAEMPVPFAAA
ncbi:MAG: metal-dependent hydrolase [Actinomycetota bacterium]